MGKGNNAHVIQSRTARGSGRGPYKFPMDSHNQLRSRITFQAINYQPPMLEPQFVATNTAKEIVGGVGKTIKDTWQGGAISAGKITPFAGDICKLYLPIAFQVADGFQYDHATLGAMGGALAGTLQRGQSIEKGVMSAIGAGFAGVADFLKIFGTSEAATRLTAVRAAETLAPQKLADAVSVSGRITLNPNLRTKFNGINIREFNFNFKLIAKSQRESVQIKNIIRFFRYHAYPDGVPPEGEYSVALNYPNMFKIRLQSGNGGTFKNIGTPIKYCYLRNISHVYNPTTPVLHSDGAPTEVDLNMTFTEYKPLRRRDILSEENETIFDRENFGGVDLDQMNQFPDPTGGYAARGQPTDQFPGLPAGDPSIYSTPLNNSRLPGLPDF